MSTISEVYPPPVAEQLVRRGTDALPILEGHIAIHHNPTIAFRVPPGYRHKKARITEKSSKLRWALKKMGTL